MEISKPTTYFFAAGKKTYQFYFENNHLVRIGVYMYEGEDKEKAAAPLTRSLNFWKGLRQSCRSGNFMSQKGSVQLTLKSTELRHWVIPVATGRTEMTPVTQPGDKRVFAANDASYSQAGKFYCR